MTQYQWALWEILRGIENDSSIKILNGCEHLQKIVGEEPISKTDIGVAKTILCLMREW